MKKVLYILTIIFLVLTFVGAGYVFYTKGEASPGYSVVPMLFCLAFSLWHKSIK